MKSNRVNRTVRRAGRQGLALGIALLMAAPMVRAQMRAQTRSTTPPWTKGVLPISPATYYDAIECGKQASTDPPCVFWDAGLCKNPDFELALYTPYKMVAYEVWRTVQQKKPAPQPNYAEAQRTHVTIGVTQVRGSTNTLTDLVLKRGGTAVAPLARSLPTGRFTYDYPALAATAPVMLELVGKAKTVTCTIDRAVLATFR